MFSALPRRLGGTAARSTAARPILQLARKVFDNSSIASITRHCLRFLTDRPIRKDKSWPPRELDIFRFRPEGSLGVLVRAGWRITNGILHIAGAVRWTRLFAPPAAPNIRRAVSRRWSASFAKRSGNTFRRADKLGQRWRRWRLDISTHTASTSLE